MTLTKDDLQAIGTVIRPIVKEEIGVVEKRLLSEMDKRFSAQTTHLSNAIADAVKLIAKSHPTKEEFQELRDEVEDLRAELYELKNKLAHN